MNKQEAVNKLARAISFDPASSIGPIAAAYFENRSEAACIMGPIGSAKTSVSLLKIFMNAILQKPNEQGVRPTKWAVIRDTYRNLWNTTIQSWKAWVPEELGEFKGGNISLGLRTRYEAINHYTKKLPLLTPPEELPERSRMLGKTTKTAIEYGVISSMLFEIEGYMEKYPDHKVIFTGGDAFYFADKMKKPIFVICNLVLIGLSYLAQYKSDEKDI